jgi:hypothetical protein
MELALEQRQAGRVGQWWLGAPGRYPGNWLWGVQRAWSYDNLD